MTFARTKINVPSMRPGALIGRPRLELGLGDALMTQRAVLVCAAAGFGKTTALARQVSLLPEGTAVAWVSCDEGDSSLQLLRCVLAGLEPFDVPWRTDPDVLMRLAAEAPTTHQLRQIAAQVINALDACDVPHGVIVIDDFHRLGDQSVLPFLDALLEHFSQRWTLVIASRRPPALALGRLRAQGVVTEFDAHDLRFDLEDVTSLAVHTGSDGLDAGRLLQRTDGWPAGLRLAMSQLRLGARRPVQSVEATINRHVFDFLLAEVIDQMDPALREFVMVTSVLPELSASRCAALTGDIHSAQRLEHVEREGLFVSVVASLELTLRLHDLFRSALETTFSRERPAEYLNTLRRAAASEVDPVRRTQWLLRAQDWDEAEAVLTDCADALIASGEADRVRALFESFPAEWRAGSPRLSLLLARTRWDWDTAIAASEEAAHAFGQLGNAPGRLEALSHLVVALAGANLQTRGTAVANLLLVEPALAGGALSRALSGSAWLKLATGDVGSLPALWDRMLDELQATTALERWSECAPLAPYIGVPGMGIRLQRFVDGASRRVPDHPTPLRGACSVMSGWLQLWAGDIAGAEASVAHGADDCRWLGNPPSLDAPVRSLRAVLLAIRGHGAESLAMLQALVDGILASGVSMRIEVYLDLYRFLGVRCAAMLDDPQSLRGFAEGLDDAGSLRTWLTATRREGVAALVSTSSGDVDAACAHWHELIDAGVEADLYGQVAEARVRLADALVRKGAPLPEAARILRPLLVEVAISRESGPFFFAGPAVMQRLTSVAWGDTLGQSEQALLNALASSVGESAGKVRVASPPAETQPGAVVAGAVMALSAREWEVLQCIALGKSNKVIARELELSPHTVKRHVANILDKLVLDSRGQAAHWYQMQPDR